MSDPIAPESPQPIADIEIILSDYREFNNQPQSLRLGIHYFAALNRIRVDDLTHNTNIVGRPPFGFELPLIQEVARLHKLIGDLRALLSIKRLDLIQEKLNEPPEAERR